jgi:hypothetical protein
MGLVLILVWKLCNGNSYVARGMGLNMEDVR